MISRLGVGAVAVAFVLGFSACTTTDESASVTTTVRTVDELLAASADAMAEIRTARFSIEQTGAAVAIDDDGLITFGGATGRYAAPDSADALVSVDALGLATEIGAVAIGGEIWITNPLTGKWEVAPSSFTFDPSVLFDPVDGWSGLLSTGLEGARLLNPDADENGRLTVIATIAAERVAVLTGGLVEESSEVELLIDAETTRLAVVSFDVDTSDGPTSWLLELSDYDADVSIAKPDLIDGN